MTGNDGALQAQDVFYDIYDSYTSVQAGQSTQQGQSIIANADTVTAYGNAVGQQIDMLAFSRDLIIYGRAGADTIYTGTGDNFVTGGSEGDVIIGDAGSDILIAGELFDDVTRASLDQIRSDFDEARMDILSGDDLSAVAVFGGGFFGEDINGDTLNGGDGNDYLFGDGSAGEDFDGNGQVDVLHGNDGDDVLVVQGGWSLFGEDEAYGDAGNDILIHTGWGYAQLHGGAGDDIYYVNNWSDVIESVGQGTDTVVIAGLVAWTLWDYVENLTNIGSGATLIGNELDNVITGGDEQDVINAGAGADTVIGGGGNDIIDLGTAEEGNTVVFASGGGVDTVLYFGGGANDKIKFSDFIDRDGALTTLLRQAAAVDADDDAIIAANTEVLEVTGATINVGSVEADIATAIGSAFDLTNLADGRVIFNVQTIVDETVQNYVGYYNNSGSDDLIDAVEIELLGVITQSGTGSIDYDNYLLAATAPI